MTPSDIFLRPITLSDEPFLWEMLYQALFVPAGQPPLPREIVHAPEIARYVDGWGRKGDQGWIAVDQGAARPVGAVWIRTFTRDHPGYGFINPQTPELSIAILPAYRNQGIGSALLEHMIHEVESEVPALSLSVSSDNPAVKLYTRFGFETVSQKEQSLTMVKVFPGNL